jgi:hypothetical protein
MNTLGLNIIPSPEWDLTHPKGPHSFAAAFMSVPGWLRFDNLNLPAAIRLMNGHSQV